MERKKPKKNILFTITIISVVITLLIGAGIVIYGAKIIRELPSPDEFASRRINQTTKIYDRTGKVLLYEVHGEEKRTIIPFEKIPTVLKKATLAAENDTFYKDPAFNWRGIVRALIKNIKEGRITQGGSTITQQLAKKAFLSDERTVSRKIKELILAIQLESKYTKDEIFSLYLNQIPYGSNAYGVEAASQAYFGKTVTDISLGEAAVLASLPKAPSYYSPWGNHVEDLLTRKNHIIERMEKLGLINKEETEKAKVEEIKFSKQTIGNIKAPHFSLAVKDYLTEKYGEDMVLNGGLKVITTLDWQLQEIGETVVKEGAERNAELYKGTNAALVAQDPKTGQVLVLVGSRDYFNEEIEGRFNVPLQGLRQPGSALKPFAYLTAFEKGYQPKTVIFDVPTEFDATGNPDRSYKPENYEGKIHGPISLEESLAQSVNVSSVKVLYLAGFSDTLKNIEKFGIKTLKERGRYGLSLILGGGEVKLSELVNAYATMSQEGMHHKQIMILKIEKSDGKILEEYENYTTKVMDPQYPRMINQILSDRNLRSPLFQNSLSLTLFPNHEVALKTGTTNDYRDAWALGYTPSLVAGVWAGNNNNEPMQRRGGSILAAVPIWSAFLNRALTYFPSETFIRPDPIPPVNKPMMNGEIIYAPIIDGKTNPQIHSILYYVDKNDPLGPIPENPDKDPQFKNWEEGVFAWAKENIKDYELYNALITSSTSFISNEAVNEENPVIKNLSPKNGEFIISPTIITADIESKKMLKMIEISINQNKIASLPISGNTYHLSYTTNVPLNPQNSIEIKAINEAGRESRTQVIVFKK